MPMKKNIQRIRIGIVEEEKAFEFKSNELSLSPNELNLS